MGAVLIEIECPNHGLERFKIKVIKKWNMKSNTIIPVYRKKPSKEISSLLIGKNVDEKEAKEYLVRYFKEKGMFQSILRMTIIK